CLGAASAKATKAATATSLLTRRPQELLELLRSTGERVQCIRGIVASGLSRASPSARGANHRTFTGAWIPRAATSTATAAAEQPGHVATHHQLADAVERRLWHGTSLLE